MMHGWVSRRLSGLLDGELPSRTRFAVERHLARCPRCAQRREGLRRARAAVQAAPRSGPPPEAWGRLREQMAAQAEAPPQRHRVPPTAPTPLGVGGMAGARPWRPVWTVAGAAGGVLVALAASFYLISGPWPPAADRNTASFVTTADLVDLDPVSLSPSIELLLVARRNGGLDPGGDR